MNLCQQYTIHPIHYVKVSANFVNSFPSSKYYFVVEVDRFRGLALYVRDGFSAYTQRSYKLDAVKS